MNEAIHVPPMPPSVAPERVLFTGKRADFRRMVTRGGLLELVTLGFYRFWLTTDMRRHLWSHTVVEGDSFEYTGRAKELLIGFLVALAILMPVYLVYFLIGLEAERYRAFASFPLVLFMYLFGQFAIYRARRYRLSRTVWRGVRFWMTGSGWAYAWRALLWGIFAAITLGLALPWRDAALERYKMRHSHYGSAPGRFEGSGWEFFKRGWWVWLLSWTIVGAVVALIIVPLLIWGQSASGGLWSAILWIMTSVTLGLILAFVAAPFLFAAFRSIQWKWWIEGIRFGDVKATSSLRVGGLIGRYWAVIGWSFLLLFAFGTVNSIAGITVGATFGSKGAFVGGNIENILNNGPMIAFVIVSYLLMIIAVNIVMRLYLGHDVWQRVVASISLTGLDSVRDVEVKGDLATALGEGIADGLDVGGF
jgi:uncharacterized membrane protein YjgN (DUF898 family)